MGDVFQRTLHHPDDGAFLRLHRTHLQRLFLQVTQHFWLLLECEGYVRKSAVDVSCQYKYIHGIQIFVHSISIHADALFFYIAGTKRSKQTLCSR